MAIDDADQSGSGQFAETEASGSVMDEQSTPTRESDVRVGTYTWADFMEEHGYGHEVPTLYPHGTEGPDDQLGLDTDEAARSTVPKGDDWDRVEFDPTAFLGYHPDELPHLINDVFAANADTLQDIFLKYVHPDTRVTKDFYTWEHYKWEYYYEDDGTPPQEAFDPTDALGFDPDLLPQLLHAGGNAAMDLDDVIDERTVNVNEDLDEDKFFSTVTGHTTVSNRYDLEKAVPYPKKTHFREVERYWVNKPYAFVVIFHSEKENEKKYYMVEPYCNEIEEDLQEFLSGKLRTAIKYSDEGIKQKANEDGRREVIERETRRLLKRYDLFVKTDNQRTKGLLETLKNLLDDDEDDHETFVGKLDGIEARPEPALLEEDAETLNEYQVEKLLYRLKRNFIGYERIDGIKHDINVEDISVDGYNSPVFVYHSGYEQIISNIYHGEQELDDFVVKLAQRSGKGISKRLPQVDATLPDGSRAQLTLGKEVSDHGTNYTIRQFKDVPFTPIDLINWNTFSLDEMAFLWLAIENHKSLIFAGGTASGKTTSLNAVSLFIPSATKIVSIEDTREVELPQRNWIASVTRPSFSDDDRGDVDEFDLLEAALRQRPDYIVMGEIRGEEGRTLFQVMSTGHTTYTTFHADSVDEVLKRFTTDPINVSKTMFTALDLVSIQTQTRVQGAKVRRNKSLTEINHYEAEHDEINVQDVYQWQAETDEYLKMGDSNTLEEIKFDRGWNHEKLQNELFEREVILAYLIKNDLNTYAQVAATVQAYINDPDTILTLIANGQLENSLEDLREMESVLIDVDPEKEELVPRPDSTDETYNLATDILERAEESLFEEYRGKTPSGLASALGQIEPEETIEVDRADVDDFDFGGVVDQTVEDDEWELGDSETEFDFGTDESLGETPAWLEDDDEFDVGEATASTDEAGETATAPETETETETTAASSAADETPATSESTDAPALEAAPSETASHESTAETESVAETEPSTDTTAQPGLPAADETTDQPLFAEIDADDASEITAWEAATPASADEDESIDSLFSNMDSTLRDLEQTKAAREEADLDLDEPAREQVDTAGFDAMFADDDMDSIFGGEDEAGDADEQQTTSTFDMAAQAETQTEDLELGVPDEPDDSVDVSEEPDATAEAAEEAQPEREVDHDETESVGDDDAVENATTEDLELEDPDEEPETEQPGVDEDEQSDTAQNEPEPDHEHEPERETEPDHEATDTTTDDTDDSIFGTTTESVFSEDEAARAEAMPEDSLFDTDEASMFDDDGDGDVDVDDGSGVDIDGDPDTVESSADEPTDSEEQ